MVAVLDVNGNPVLDVNGEVQLTAVNDALAVQAAVEYNLVTCDHSGVENRVDGCYRPEHHDGVRVGEKRLGRLEMRKSRACTVTSADIPAGWSAGDGVTVAMPLGGSLVTVICLPHGRVLDNAEFEALRTIAEATTPL